MRKNIRTYITNTLLLAAGFLAFSVITQAPSALAHDGDDHGDSGGHSYTAQAGDSLTIFARDAISAHAEEEEISLTPAQRVFAETTAVAKLGGELLEIGQKVTIPNDTVQAAIESAQKLSAESQAAWQPYAALVDYSVPAVADESRETDAADQAATDDEDERDGGETANSDDEKEEDTNRPWYANVFTWVLIIAVAIIGWSLFASRKTDDKK